MIMKKSEDNANLHMNIYSEKLINSYGHCRLISMLSLDNKQ